MFNGKIRKVACLVLATVMTFSGLNIQTKEVKANNEIDASKYNYFADAVEAMYKGDTDRVVGDYELAYFSDNYEYSVVKNDVNSYYPINTSESIRVNQANCSFLWNEEEFSTDKYGLKKFKSASYPMNIYHIKGSTKISLVDVETSVSNNWNYDVITLDCAGYGYGGGRVSSETLAVNIRPNKPISGTITLPAYINDDTYGKIKCVEIGDGAFLKNSELKEVHIPDTYQRVCAYAFTGCTSLESVKFVSTKETNSGIGYTIDKSASYEQSMKNSNIHFLGTGAFAGCKELKTAVLPEQLTEGYVYVNNPDSDNPEVKGFAGVHNGEFNYVDGYYVSGSSYKTFEGVKNGDIISKEGDSLKNSLTYLGQGVYRDCYKLTSVDIKGINPFIPACTFAGCADISSINLADTVKRVYFGVASFAGADGNNDTPSDRSALSKLDLTSENLEDVIIGAYAFKNCFSLKDVNITVPLNVNALNEKVQNAYLKNEYAFENSFAKDGSFKYTSKDDSDFSVPVGMFKNCANLKSVEFKGVRDLTVCSKAFENIGCSDLQLGANKLILKTSSLYGLMNTSSLILSGDYVDFSGEPFSNSLKNYKTNIFSSVRNLKIDSKDVYFGTEEIKSSGNVNGKIVDGSYTTSASFYGLGDTTTVTFTDNVESINGSVSNVNGKSTVITENGNGTYKSVYHNGLGEIKKVCFMGYSTYINGDKGNYTTVETKLFDAPLTTADYYNKNLNTVIYADGNTYNVLNTLVKTINSSKITLSSYISSIFNTEMTWLSSSTEFDASRVNEGRGIQVQYADGTFGYIPYSEEEQNAGATDGVNGYIITNLEEVKNSIKEGQKVNLSVSYRGKVGVIVASVISKKPVSMDVTSSTVIEGTTPKTSDIKLSNVEYNDGTKDLTISDYSDVTVSLADGSNTYKLGENEVTVSYKGYDKQVVVNAEKEKVVTLSAIQVGNPIYTGDEITKSNLSVTAYYNSGKVDANFTDYEILDKVVTENTKSVYIKSQEGVLCSVNLIVTPVNPKSISVEYNGTEVQEGTEVSKDNFKVVLTYDNGNSRVLTNDEFDLVYSVIVGNSSNPVKVVYKGNESLSQIVFVTGVKYFVPTKEPMITNSPSSSDAPVVPTASSVVSSTPDVTTVPQISNSPVPTATATTTPTVAPTSTNSVLPDNKQPNSGVVTGGSVTASPSPASGSKPLTAKVTLGVGEKFKTSSSSLTSPVLFSTSNNKIAVISKTGVITAKGVGTTKIVLTDTTGRTKIYTVVVKKAPKKVKINFKTKKLKKGKTAKIKVSLGSGYYSRVITYKSSNKKVATVTSKGVIKAKKKGSCKITVSTYNKKKVTIKVTVK